MPKIAGFASCSTKELIFFNPKQRTVARFAGFCPIVLFTSVILILFDPAIV